jgi:hypothetical protein
MAGRIAERLPVESLRIVRLLETEAALREIQLHRNLTFAELPEA